MDEPSPDTHKNMKDAFFAFGYAKDIKDEHSACAKMLSRIYKEYEQSGDSDAFLGWLSGFTRNDTKCPDYLIELGLLLKIDETTYVTPLGLQVGYLLALNETVKK